MENAPNNGDMDLFYDLTKVAIADGNKATFIHAHWADGMNPNFMASSIFKFSKQKKLVG
jgi:hypothetical protein